MQGITETKDELKKIIKYLKANGYEYDNVYHTSCDGSYDDDIEARFKKENLYVDDGNGELANDSHIVVRIEFDSRADANNYSEDPVEDGYRYRGQGAVDFVGNLYDDIPNANQTDDGRIQTDYANGGRARSKKRRKPRKTRKTKK